MSRPSSAAASLALELFGAASHPGSSDEPARCSHASISGRSSGRSSSGSTACDSARRPGGQALAVVSRGLCAAIARPEYRLRAIRDGQLGFLLGVELAGLARTRRTISARSRSAQLAGSIGQRRTCDGPSRQSERRPQSGRRNSRAGDRSIFWSDCGGLLVAGTPRGLRGRTRTRRRLDGRTS